MTLETLIGFQQCLNSIRKVHSSQLPKEKRKKKRFQLQQTKRARALLIRQATEPEEAEVEEPCNLEPDLSLLKKIWSFWSSN